tara:strand:- start:6895 stop:8259 length:1365 start_codon:yes stop_codon:yes gene_type:complete
MANIYLQVEIKKRDLMSRVLIGMNSALQNNIVYVGDLSKYLLNSRLSQGIFLDKSISRIQSKSNKLKKIKSLGNIITSIDEECGVTHNDYESFATLRFSEENLKYTSAIFCWGNKDYNFLKKRYSKFKHKFFKTGSARNDICFILKKFDSKKRLKNLPPKNYLLINSNFGTILTHKPFFKVLRDRRNYYLSKNRKLYKNVETEKFRLERDSWRISILQHYIELIKQLKEKVKNLKIVIRPHPSENINHWKEFLGNETNNILISNDYTSNEMINFCELVIHTGCHTALEAKLMEKSVISFNPQKKHKFERKFYTDCGVEINDINNLIKYIKQKKYLLKKNKNSFSKNFKNSIFLNKKKYSAELISEVFEKLILGSKLNKQKKTYKNFIFLNLLNIKDNITNFFKHKRLKKYHEHKFEKIKKKEVKEIIDLIKKTNIRFKDLKFQIYGDRVLKIWK